MSNEGPPVEIRIGIEGFIAGMLAGIGLKMGVTPDEGGLLLFFMKAFCQITEETSKYFNCWQNYLLLSVLVIVITIFSIITEITKVDNYKLGLLIYGFGFILGTLFVILTV